MTVCARRCAHTGLHAAGCRDGAECRGCLPKEAVLGGWCASCVHRVRGDLVDLPGLAADVAGLEDGQLNTAPGPVTDAPRAPSPAPRSVSPAWDEADEALRWLQSWTDLVCELVGIAGPVRYSVTAVPVLQGEACMRFLLEWLWVPAGYDPVQFFDEATRLHRQLVRATGTDEVVERIKQDCPRCGLRMMSRENGSDSVVCGNEDCLAVWRSAEWAALVGTS